MGEDGAGYSSIVMRASAQRGMHLKECATCSGLYVDNKDGDPELRVRAFLTAAVAVSEKKECKCATTKQRARKTR